MLQTSCLYLLCFVYCWCIACASDLVFFLQQPQYVPLFACVHYAITSLDAKRNPTAQWLIHSMLVHSIVLNCTHCPFVRVTKTCKHHILSFLSNDGIHGQLSIISDLDSLESQHIKFAGCRISCIQLVGSNSVLLSLAGFSHSSSRHIVCENMGDHIGAQKHNYAPMLLL